MLDAITKLYQDGVRHGVQDTYAWLNGMTASQAFVACVGAGPWKLPRRRLIQTQALLALGAEDLRDRYPQYPLTWQNSMVRSMHEFLHEKNITMSDLCAQAVAHDDRHTIYKAAGVPAGTKVLSLFCRDFLRIAAFPIDRHVRRVLKERGLPTEETALVQLCRQAKLDPRIVATVAVRIGSDDRQGALNATDLLESVTRTRQNAYTEHPRAAASDP